MYVPASDQKKVLKTTTLSVDSLIFDIEDGVAVNKKVNFLTFSLTKYFLGCC